MPESSLVLSRTTQSCLLLRKDEIVGNKAKGRTCAYQGVRNVRFSENLACFVFLKHLFWDSRFCFITNEIRPNNWPEISWLKFVKRTSTSNPVTSHRYIKCYCSSSPRAIKSSGNSIRYSFQKIYSWSRRPVTLLEIREKATFLEGINNLIMYKFLKDFSNQRKKTNQMLVFSHIPLPILLKYRDHRWDLLAVYKIRFLQTYWRFQLACMKV